MQREKTMKQTPPSKLSTIGDIASLLLTTVVLVGVLATSYLANFAGLGSLFKNTTAQVSDKYFTQV